MEKIRNKQQYELLDGSGRQSINSIPAHPYFRHRLVILCSGIDPVQILRGQKYRGITAQAQITASTKRTYNKQPQVMKNQQARGPKY